MGGRKRGGSGSEGKGGKSGGGGRGDGRRKGGGVEEAVKKAYSEKSCSHEEEILLRSSAC